MTDEKLELDLEEPESLELEPTTPAGNIIVIPPDVIRTVSELPSDPEIGTVVALVSDDESKVNGFYIATEKTSEGTVWALYVTSGTGEIADKSITERKIAYNSINRFHIQEDAVETKHIAPFAVDGVALGLKSVGDGHINDNAVHENHISKDSVTTEKIKNKAITKDKLDDEAFRALTVAEDSIETKHLQSFAVTGEKVAYNTLTGAHFKTQSISDSAIGNVSGEKLNNKSIPHEKMVEDYATKDYVNNTVKNVVAAEPLIKSEITIPDNFENYESYQVVEITEKVQKDWKNVKIWSSADGLIAESSNPTDFDFSQIPETNYAEISDFPTVLDMSSIENENSVDALAFYDESAKKFLIIQYLCGIVGLNLYDGTTNEYYVIQYTPDIGWTNHDKLVSDEYLSKFTGVYPTLKFVDIGEVFANTFPEEEIIPEGAIHTPGLLLNLLLKHIMAVYYPPGYYLTERTEEYATKEDITEINERLDTLVPKAWADVQQLVRSGKASQAFSIGDQLVCSKNGIAHVWDIIGFDVDTPINPNYTHSMTLQLNTAFEGVAFDDSSNDYSSSDIRTHLNGDYLTGFDEDFLSVIGGIRKSELLYNTDDESEEDDIYPESDIFFLLSADEVSSNPYEYYSSAEADATIRIKFLGSNYLTNWRLRSTNLSGNAANITDVVSTDGSITSGSIGRASYSLAPACVIY